MIMNTKNEIKVFMVFLYGVIVTIAKIPFVLLVVVLTWLLKFVLFLVHEKGITDKTFK